MTADIAGPGFNKSRPGRGHLLQALALQLERINGTSPVSLGAQVTLNGAAQTRDRVSIIGLFEVFYNDVFPALGWEPF
jgi:hypothetical protein